MPEARLEISTPPTTEPWSIAISPDGLTVAFVAESEGQPALWLRPLNAVAAQPLAGTTGATLPFWSPDSKAIGFFAGGKLKRIDAAGGAAQTLADAHQPHGGTWGPDGSIVFSPHQISPLLRVSAGGGEPGAVTQLSSGQVGHHFPQFLPDGIHLLYYAGGGPEVRGDYIGTLDGKLSRRLMDARSPAAFLPPGHILFVRENVLFAQALDPIGLELKGNAVRIADSVVVSSGPGGTDPAAMSASNTGDILYRRAANDSRRQLTWID